MHFVVNDKKFPLGTIVEHLKHERKRLDDSILALERLPGLLPSLEEDAVPTTLLKEVAKGPECDRTNYAEMSAPKAAADCLRRAGKPLPTKELIERMLAGGFTTRAKNFEANLYTVLSHRQDLFIRVSPGIWSLA